MDAYRPANKPDKPLNDRNLTERFIIFRISCSAANCSDFSIKSTLNCKVKYFFEVTNKNYIFYVFGENSKNTAK